MPLLPTPRRCRLLRPGHHDGFRSDPRYVMDADSPAAAAAPSPVAAAPPAPAGRPAGARPPKHPKAAVPPDGKEKGRKTLGFGRNAKKSTASTPRTTPPVPSTVPTRANPRSESPPLSPPATHSMVATPLALVADLIEDILLRFPPADPASLVRAALVCKEWCRIVSGPGFRRQFCELHQVPPMLGIFCNINDDEVVCISRFFPTSPSCPPHADLRGRRMLDARHGRVLLSRVFPAGEIFPCFEVWDLFTEERWELPVVLTSEGFPYAAVLCAAHGTCDHLDCHGGPFLVVFLDTDRYLMCVHVYSSEAGAWSEPTYGPQSPTSICFSKVLVGSALYFLLDDYSILKYEIVMANMTVIQLPPNVIEDFAMLTAVQNGGLVFARLGRSGLYHWSLVTGPKGDAGWTQTAVIQIHTLLPVSVEISYVFSCDHGVRVFFVGTNEGLFSIDLKSRQVRKICDEDCCIDVLDGVIPYMSFYTPDLYRYCLPPA